MSRVSRPCLALALAVGAQGLSALPAAGGALGDRPLPLPFDSTVVVTGRDVSAGFALKELNCIVKAAAGREFQIEKVGGESRWTKDGSSLDCNSKTQTLKNSNTSTAPLHHSTTPPPHHSTTPPPHHSTLKNSNTSTVQPSTSNTQTLKNSNTTHRLFLGRSPESERLLGSAFFDSLADEESVVMAKGNDLFLVGGGDLGTLWAVYDFVEDNLGYRWYFSRKDGEVIDKTSSVVWNGRPTRKRPSFKGFRKIYTEVPVGSHFRLRNREQQVADQFIKGYRFEHKWQVPGHGFLLYLPAKDLVGWGNMIPPTIKGCFKEHPEYFSVGPDGKRHADMQLCLSSRVTREALYGKILEWIAYKGAYGIYMLGSNDTHNDRYCWCKDCIALEKKYDSIGGPLWDFILEACARLKKDGYDKVYLSSLVYKGPGQTEKAPKGIEKFPDNFVADLAFLNGDRSIREFPVQKGIDGGKDFNKWENAQVWSRLCDHKSYWYYGGCHFSLVWQRMQKEILELRELGVESVGACGAGGGFSFGDMTYYLFLRLLREPDLDVRPVVAEMLRVKFGKAAPLMMKFLDETHAALVRSYPRGEFSIGCCTSTGGSFFTGREIADWQKLFDEADALVGGEEPYAKNLRRARMDVDVCTVMYAKRVRTEAPDYVFDVAKLIARSTAAEKDLQAERRLGSDFRGVVAGAFSAYANFATLKTDKLPDELRGEDPEKVTLILPPKTGKHQCQHRPKLLSEPDPRAASGMASGDTVDDLDIDYSKGVHLQFYDWANRKFLFSDYIPLAKLKSGEYVLCKTKTAKLSPSVSIIIGDDWDSALACNQFSRFYDPTFENREYEIWVSIRADGPKFFPGEKGPSRLYWDRIYMVDRGVPAGK